MSQSHFPEFVLSLLKTFVKPLLILSPYILVPLLMSLVFKWAGIPWKGLTYLFTAILIFYYPTLLFQIDNYLNPPQPGPRCLLPETAFYMGNLFLFLPVSLGIQLFFNVKILNRKKIDY
jgi:hypothetical protein